MICNGKEFPVNRGMVCFMSPMDFHGYQQCDQMDLINIQFSEGDISAHLLNQFVMQRSRVVYVDEAKFASMESLCQLLGSLHDGKQTRDYDKKLLECMIITFLSCCKQDASLNYSLSGIQRAVMYIHAHFKEDPSMQEVARLHAYDPSYFSRLFKKSVGVSYTAYIRNLKLDYGMKLIRFTDLPMVEVASACGYKTQTHFNRDFKARFQAPPSAHRK